MSQTIVSDFSLFPVCADVPVEPDRERRKRILSALGLPSGRPKSRGGEALRVSEDSLARYFDYLSERLQMPFVAYYPPPSSPAHAAVDRCEVVELLDPRKDLCDEVDGLYCRTRKGRFVVNLPLVELTVLPPNTNLELLGDYEYWFWNWRDA